jgi:hypothetical protein
MTDLAGLALLLENEDASYFGKVVTESNREIKRAPTVRKAADWLMAQSQPGRDGLIFSDHVSETTRYMQGHGLATIFLAGACEHETDADCRKKLTEVLERAVQYIAKAQSTQGGWHDTSKVEGHDFATIPATVIQIQALQAAENAGVSIPPGVLNDGQEYLKTSLKKGIGPAETAGALACLGRPGIGVGGLGPDGPGGGGPLDRSPAKSLQKWFDVCRSGIPVGKELKFGRAELAHYWYAQAEHHRGGDTWSAYRTSMFDRLRDAQKEDGSWPAGEGMCSGPVYAAAVWCTVLQLDNESHPSRQRTFLELE